jgi:xanthosine utilization system XapX-like protein
MAGSTMRGLIAGATGTVALDLATYADMALRGRSSSSAPSKMIDKVTKQLHLPLSPQGVGAQDETTQNRESGLGALLGYVNGLGTGILYGLLRSRFDGIPAPLAAPLVGMTAMAASDVPLVSLGVTNPKTWGLSGWLSDAIPHLIYGIVTVATYEAITR